MKNYRRWIAIAGAIALGAVVVAWLVSQYLHRDARALLELLPPDAHAYAVIDLEILQSNPALKSLIAEPPPGALSAGYRQLLSETGFRFQDDLKQVAAAKSGPDWVGAAVVNLDRVRITGYLEAQEAVISELEGRTVYSFGTERPFHLAFLNDRMVAFAVGESLDSLRQVLARHTSQSVESANDYLTQAGLLSRFPSGSGLWFVGRMDRLLATDPAGPGVGPFQFGRDWWEGSKLVIANVMSGPLRLDIQLENQCESVATAERMANALIAVLAILQAVPEGESNGKNYAPLLAGIAIRQGGESVFLNWSWDPQMLSLLSGEGR